MDINVLIVLGGAFFIGMIAFVSYSIWHDAFLPVGQNRVLYMIFCAIIAVTQFMNFFRHDDWSDVNALLNSERILNLGCAGMFLIVLILLILKQILNRREEA